MRHDGHPAVVDPVQDDVGSKDEGDVVLYPPTERVDDVLVCCDRAHADGRYRGDALLAMKVFGEGDDVDFIADDVVFWLLMGVEVDELKAVDEGCCVAVDAVEEDLGRRVGGHFVFDVEVVFVTSL